MPVDIDEIRYKVEDYLLFCMSNEHALAGIRGNEEQVYDALEGFVFRDAGRVRPVLLVLSYEGYASRQDSDMAFRAAAAVELMHTFALVHDDITDNAAERGTVPSLHAALDKLPDRAGRTAKGKELAMLLGDLLYNMALSEFSKLDIPAGKRDQALGIAVETALQTVRGQLEEQVLAKRGIPGTRPSGILKIYDLKTARYTFCLPLKLGAVLAGEASEGELARLDEAGLLAGRAYQIVDDIDDHDPEDMFCCDYLSALLWKQCSAAERKTLRTAMTSRKPSKEDISCFSSLYKKHDIRSMAAEDAHGFLKSALDTVRSLEMSSEIKRELGNYIFSIFPKL
ncbi:MAG: polyprenyl synthetase family protein [Victivallales bacterium]|nr:polyprenyl synthetase family protein [Victivallales bacterium]